MSNRILEVAVPTADRRSDTSRVTELVAAAAALSEQFAEGAADRDRERLLPVEQVRALADAGVLGITVPREFGGPGGGAEAAAEVSRLLATTDPNIAQIPHSHFVYLRFIEIAGGDQLKRRIFGDVLAGSTVANAQSERGGRTGNDISTRVDFVGGGAVVNGRKFYATGSLFADWLAIWARASDGSDHIVFVPAAETGVEIIDDWSSFGQRTTGSGTVAFSDVQALPEFVAPRAEALTGPHAYGPFAQVLHAAIDTGVARGALDDAAAFVRDRSRPWFEAGVDTAAQDPLTVQRFGDLEVEVRAAEASLKMAALAVDRAFASRTASVHAEASLAVAAAKVLSDRAANDVTTALFELTGTSATDAALGLDRHWRNGRVHTAHDPVRWKIQHLGRWTLNRVLPPRHGQI
jgi:SfnB family sulfur acquisition oxidoreductase